MTNNLLEADFTAPQAEYTWDRVTVAASQIQVTDLVKKSTLSTPVEVCKTKTGPKWTALFDDQGKRILLLENDREVEVLRRTQTNQEAQYRAFRNKRIQDRLASRTDRLQAAQGNLNARLNDGREADYNVIGELLLAQAELKLLHWFAGAAVTAEEGVDLVDIRNRMCEQLQGRLVQEAQHRALSRSTSVVSNVMEDCDREAMATFLDTYWV